MVKESKTRLLHKSYFNLHSGHQICLPADQQRSLSTFWSTQCDQLHSNSPLQNRQGNKLWHVQRNKWFLSWESKCTLKVISDNQPNQRSLTLGRYFGRWEQICKSKMFRLTLDVWEFLRYMFIDTLEYLEIRQNFVYLKMLSTCMYPDIFEDWNKTGDIKSFA